MNVWIYRNHHKITYCSSKSWILDCPSFRTGITPKSSIPWLHFPIRLNNLLFVPRTCSDVKSNQWHFPSLCQLPLQSWVCKSALAPQEGEHAYLHLSAMRLWRCTGTNKRHIYFSLVLFLLLIFLSVLHPVFVSGAFFYLSWMLSLKVFIVSFSVHFRLVHFSLLSHYIMLLPFFLHRGAYSSA